MATAYEDVSIPAGPKCPVCTSDELRWGAPLGALWHGQCRGCGIAYSWSDDDEQPEPTCRGCAMPHDESRTGSPYCDDCNPTPCQYCGTTVFLSELSANQACRICEEGEAA
jgi:hypothetical protein